MTETKVIQVEAPLVQKLDLKKLKTVQWIGSNYVFQQGLKFSSEQYRRMTAVTFLAYLFAPIELLFISFFLFIHQLPWPQFMLNIIFKIDLIIEDILEFIGRKVEWWIDIIAVRLMRLRDSLEAFIDTVLSLVMFISYQVFDLWRWTLRITLGFLLWLFFPLVWIANKILPHEKIRRPTSIVPPNANGLQETSVSTQPQHFIEEDLKNNTSDSESDVSLVSESWTIDQMNQSRKNINRLEMKATAEGRLRAAMYKRVKSQLTIMRKNSVHFSRGMVIAFEPTLKPIEEHLGNFIKKFHLDYYYNRFLELIDPIISKVRIAKMINAFKSVVISVLGTKRKSRRTRSMRSESLRRINLVAAATRANPGMGLSQSAEPVIEEKNVSAEEIYVTVPVKEDVDTEQRDSALASSIDDSSPFNSDTNENHPRLNHQTIKEEDTVQIKAEDIVKKNETNIIISSKKGKSKLPKKESKPSARNDFNRKTSLKTKTESATTTENLENKNPDQPPRKISFSNTVDFVNEFD